MRARPARHHWAALLVPESMRASVSATVERSLVQEDIVNFRLDASTRTNKVYSESLD